MISPIQVHGNDLAATLEQLKREGKYAWAVDMVGVAEYKLHINFERDLGYHAPVVGKSSEVPGLKPSGVTIAATITNEKHDFSGEACSTQARSVNPRKAAVHEQPKNVAGPLVDVEHTGNLISIEARMAALRESLAAKGKLRPIRETRQPYAY